MTALWDTTVASRVRPASAEIQHVRSRHEAGDPVEVAAPTVLEIVYGIRRETPRDARYREQLPWFTGLIGAGTISVVPFDGPAAVVAGLVRASRPHPPAGRDDRRSKTMRQAAWLMDIQIAATAFAAGLDVVTENRRDFERIGEVLAELYPSAPPLAVVDSPFTA